MATKLNQFDLTLTKYFVVNNCRIRFCTMCCDCLLARHVRATQLTSEIGRRSIRENRCVNISHFWSPCHLPQRAAGVQRWPPRRTLHWRGNGTPEGVRSLNRRCERSTCACGSSGATTCGAEGIGWVATLTNASLGSRLLSRCVPLVLKKM